MNSANHFGMTRRLTCSAVLSVAAMLPSICVADFQVLPDHTYPWFCKLVVDSRNEQFGGFGLRHASPYMTFEVSEDQIDENGRTYDSIGYWFYYLISYPQGGDEGCTEHSGIKMYNNPSAPYVGPPPPPPPTPTRWQDATSRFLRNLIGPSQNLRPNQRRDFPYRGCCGSSGGVRGSLGFSLFEGSPAFTTASDEGNPPVNGQSFFPFVVVANATNDVDALEFAVNGTTFWKRPLSEFVLDEVYLVEVPVALLNSEGEGSNFWSVQLNSDGDPRSEVYFPTEIDPAEPNLLLSGFYPPVDMLPVDNTVKNGSTVPIKFEVFDGPTELTDTSMVVQPLTATERLCSGGPTDAVELVASGATSLRYDATTGQFIYNWKTPKRPGYCYEVTVTLTDGTSQSANFKLK